MLWFESLRLPKTQCHPGESRGPLAVPLAATFNSLCRRQRHMLSPLLREPMVPGFRRDDIEFLFQVRTQPSRPHPACAARRIATGRHDPYTDGAACRPVVRPTRKGILMPRRRSLMEVTSVAGHWRWAYDGQTNHWMPPG